MDSVPTLTTASAGGTSLILTYDRPLDASSVPLTSHFSVVVDGGTATSPTAVTIAGSQVTLTLASSVDSATTVTVSYTKPTTIVGTEGPIQDLAGNEANALTNQSVEFNAPATGAPSITGPPQVGKTLSVGQGDIADIGGLPATFPDDYDIQWILVDGTSESDIAGETSTTYVPVAGDVGKTIKVEVSFEDGEGDEEELTSEETYSVLPAAASNCDSDTIWCATLTVGSEGAAVAGYDQPSGLSIGSLTTATFTLKSVDYTVDRLLVRDLNTVDFSTSPDLPDSGAGLTLHLQLISGEIDLTLEDNRASGTDADWEFSEAVRLALGAAVSDVSLLRVHDANHPVQGTTDPGTEVAVRLSRAPNAAPIGKPVIAGTMAVHGELTADLSGMADDNGLPEDDEDFDFQWIRVDGETETDIAGETSKTYTLVRSDEDKKIKVEVSYTDKHLYDEGPIASDATAAIGPPENRPATGRPVITGIVIAGETLTVDVSDIADLDGLPSTDFPDGYAIQWVRVDDGVETNISGANGVTYVVTSDDENTELKVIVAFTDGEGTRETLTSILRFVSYVDNTPGRNGELRLVKANGALSTDGEGRLEVYYKGTYEGEYTKAWGTVCDDLMDFANNEAPILMCKLIGYETGTYLTNHSYSSQNVYQPIWLDDVFCTSTEGDSLDSCNHAGWGLHNCAHSEDLALKCTGGDPYATEPDPEPDPEELPAREGPLTAIFTGIPSEHDAVSEFSFTLTFSDEVVMNDKSVLRDHALRVDGGSVTRVVRVNAGSNKGWTIYVKPNAPGDVVITLLTKQNCSDLGAICDANGRRLSGTLMHQVVGPPVLRIADAAVDEGPGATLEFRVTLSRASSGKVTVDYETIAITATSDVDFKFEKGTLTFNAGVTEKTISVEVFEDEHDDDGETLMLTLSNAVGAALYANYKNAVGTINNNDPMPKAWLARFGRAASDHAVAAISQRMSDDLQTSHLRLGSGGLVGLRDLGEELESGAIDDVTGGSDDPLHMMSSDAVHPLTDGASTGFTLSGSHGVNSAINSDVVVNGATSHGNTSGTGLEDFVRALGVPRLRDVLMNASFFYTPESSESEEGWQGSWSAWGETGGSYFSGAEENMTVNGELMSATMGIDSQWDRWLAGVALSYTEGDGAYVSDHFEAGGDVFSSLLSVNPYARYVLSDRTQLWGVLGLGIGDLLLTPRRSGEGIESDLDHAMMAVGGRTALTAFSGRAGVFELMLRSDARVTQTSSATVRGLVGATGSTSRVRSLVEGIGTVTLPNGSTLLPTLEAGIRYDDGDAEFGAGVEIGAGLGYFVGRFTVQLHARGLVAHQDAAYEERGFSSSVMYTPRSDGTGLRMQLGSAWGAAQSGVHALWQAETSQSLTQAASQNGARQMQVEVGYGFLSRWSDGLWEPFIGVDSSNRGIYTHRSGVRFNVGDRGELGLEFQRDSGLRTDDVSGIELLLIGQLRF